MSFLNGLLRQVLLYTLSLMGIQFEIFSGKKKFQTNRPIPVGPSFTTCHGRNCVSTYLLINACINKCIIDTDKEVYSVKWKLIILLPFNLNIGFGCSKEPSH